MITESFLENNNDIIFRKQWLKSFLKNDDWNYSLRIMSLLFLENDNWIILLNDYRIIFRKWWWHCSLEIMIEIISKGMIFEIVSFENNDDIIL